MCPMCHKRLPCGNRIVEEIIDGHIWVMLYYSCGKHVCGMPKDPKHPMRLYGW